MSGIALIRAISDDGSRLIGYPRRIHSSLLVDRMGTIPEDDTTQHAAGATIFDATASCVGDDKIPLLQRSIYNDTKCYTCVKVFLSIMTVMSMVIQMIVTPLYADIMCNPKTGSDAFVGSFLASMWLPPVFFLIHILFNIRRRPDRICRLPAPMKQLCLAGFLCGLSYILITFTVIPERTPTYMQSILNQSLIPFTALARYITLRKGITRAQIMFLFILVLGILITLEPNVFEMRKDIYPGHPDWTHDWYFSVIYSLAWIPMAFGYVIMENSRQHRGDSLAYLSWIFFYVFLSHFLFIWIDFVPGFGMAGRGRRTFLEKLVNGISCFFSSEPEICRDASRLAALYIVSFTAANVFSILLIRAVEGAVFTAVVLATVSPISTLFWNFFKPTPFLRWDPYLDLSTLFLAGGLLIMMPAIVAYAYLGGAEQARVSAEARAEAGARYGGIGSDNSSGSVRGIGGACGSGSGGGRPRAGSNPETLPIRYQESVPRMKRPRSWTVAYVYEPGPNSPPRREVIASTKNKRRRTTRTVAPSHRGMRKARSMPAMPAF